MPWWYPFGCIAFIVGGILIFLKPEWLWALTEQWKSYAADGPSDFYILNHQVRKSGRTSATTPNTVNSTPLILVLRI